MSELNWSGDPRLRLPRGSRTPALATAPAEQLASTPLSDFEVEQFRQNGFLVARGACSPAEQWQIRTVLESLFAHGAGRDEGNQLDMLSLDMDQRCVIQPQLVKPSLYARSLLRTDHYYRIQAIAQQLLGYEAKFCFDHCIHKPANSNAATPWHQDEAHDLNPYYRYNQISFWIGLQDTFEESGCMRYIPGSNLGAVLPHCSPNDDPRIHALECPSTNFDARAAVTVPLKAGVCVLHDGLTLHSALPNQSHADRLAYVLVFRGPPLVRKQSLRFSWLESKRTSSLQRRQRWRYRGGFLVLLLRWIRRALHTAQQRLSH